MPPAPLAPAPVAPLAPPAATEPTAATRPSRLADAIRENQAGDDRPARPGGDLSGLRSVRSEGLRGAPPSGDRGGQPDDLKRVRGIGVLIEKKLHSMGITRYQQVAEWQAADIARVSQALDFSGRIERESWVEQARILAAGGHTEFSRRADRGEAGY
jgi:predicted flap endonuclease-1-like 5' DNA nuclease